MRILLRILAQFVLINLFLCSAILPNLARAQKTNAQKTNTQKINKSKKNTLSADTINYDGQKKELHADGRVRLYINTSDGEVILFSDSLIYNQKSEKIHAEGGQFGKNAVRKNKNTNQNNGQGLLRLQSEYLIFFRSIETDSSLEAIQGENIGLRQTNKNGGYTARSLKTKKRKGTKDDWIFRGVRYTNCPICADKKLKNINKTKTKNKTKNKAKNIKQTKGEKNSSKNTSRNQPALGEQNNEEAYKHSSVRSFAPIWRVDASKVRLENFTRNDKKPLKPTARVHMYNARMSIYGMPVFYMPYFSYPRYGQRASGLLAPIYSIGGAKGYSLAIPIYWTPHKSFDITYMPTFSTAGKSSSRLEIRSEFAASSKQQKEKIDKQQELAKAKRNRKHGKEHLLKFKAGASIPHQKIIDDDSQPKFLAYTQATWLAPDGFRAEANYHFLGARDYLYNYGQGVGILSTTAPVRLNDKLNLQHFSRNGYAHLLIEQQRELYSQPRADARLLPELRYENSGNFAVNRRGAARWLAHGLWRGLEKDKQNTIADFDIPQSEKLRQDLLSAAIGLAEQRYLGAGLTGNAEAKFAINYWHQNLAQSITDEIQVLPEVQLGIEGLFAKYYENTARTLYLKPSVELYATLDQPNKGTHEELRGMLEFYGERTRLGQQLAFDTAIEGGQRFLSGLEVGVNGTRGSHFSFFAAPSVRWVNANGQENPLGNLLLGAKGNWRSHLSFAYDSAWQLPEFYLLSQKGQIAAQYARSDISLVYKEFFSLAEKTRRRYEQSLKLVGSLQATDKWSTGLALGYNFLRQDRHFDNIGFHLTYDGSCVNFKLSYDRTFYSDRKDDDNIKFSFALVF